MKSLIIAFLSFFAKFPAYLQLTKSCFQVCRKVLIFVALALMKKADGFNKRKMAFKDIPGVFYADGDTLAKIQHALFDMLRDLVDFFESNDIFYTLSGGSVLGAIRHGGFIPWDDDIDLNMPRKDFDRFKFLFDENLSQKYDLVCPEVTDGYGRLAAGIRKKNTVMKTYNDLSSRHSGLCIDIFVLENTYNNPVLRSVHGMRCLFWGYLTTCRKTYEDLPVLRPFLDYDRNLRKIFRLKLLLGRLISFVSLDRICRKAYEVYSSCHDSDSRLVSIPSGRFHFFGEMYQRKDMCESDDGMFGDLPVRLPRGADTYLKMMYGEDYMVIPPEKRRERHPLMELNLGEAV